MVERCQRLCMVRGQVFGMSHVYDRMVDGVQRRRKAGRRSMRPDAQRPTRLRVVAFAHMQPQDVLILNCANFGRMPEFWVYPE